LGRNWLGKLKLNWKSLFESLHSVTVIESPLKQMLSKYEEVFCSELGTFKGVKAKISVDPLCNPRYYKARRIGPIA
jgi:hypothetical protein